MGIKNAGEMNFIPTHQLLARNLCYAFNAHSRADENPIP